MTIVVKIAIFFMNLIYRIFWICPVQNKIVFISRESNEPSVDFLRLEKELLENYPECKVKMLCKMMGPTYPFHMVRQMYHLATAKVVALDTYCIAASVLKHRKHLKIVQMWHAVGCLKKFSYSILGQAEGRNDKMARLLKMHRNYDAIWVSSDICKPYLAEAYDCKQDVMHVVPLPRVDLLTRPEEKEKSCKKILEKYPELQEKKTILYVPTFRKTGNQDDAICDLIANIDLQKYNFVLKYHPIVRDGALLEGVITDQTFSSLEWMSICDYVITDYSAVSYEAAIAGKPLFFYNYDWEQYEEGRSFYIDYQKEMPGIISGDPKRIAEAIEAEEYDLEQIRSFAEKYIEKDENYTQKAAKFLVDCM